MDKIKLLILLSVLFSSLKYFFLALFYNILEDYIRFIVYMKFKFHVI